MKGIVKLAAAIAAIGLVGLLALSVLSVVVAIGAPMYATVVPREEVHLLHPREAGAVVDAVYYNNSSSHGYAAPQAPFTSWAGVVVASATVGVILFGLAIAALIALKMLRGRTPVAAPADGAELGALHRQAQSLTERLEALETLLLERGPHGR
ncbi:MAG: hypothetical protein KF886_07845 [Candidatus Hydrogenedentes bacterium]|nr:hypothetical protein [Candidatus Hydrogenedentota bacterium]